MPNETLDVRRLTNPDAANASVVYAVGDIHGRLDLLEKMEAAIGQDIDRAHPSAPLICYLGDYIDRGPHSAQVLTRLCGSFDDGVARVFLKGNHEDRMIDFLADPAGNGASWMRFGGREALGSYGIIVPNDIDGDVNWETLGDALNNALPDAHRVFLSDLQLGMVWRDYLLVHAGLNPFAPMDAQQPRDLMWIREPFLNSDRDWGLTIVHGHVIVDEPEFHANRIAIDTGAYRSGQLTSLVLSRSEPRILQVS